MIFCIRTSQMFVGRMGELRFSETPTSEKFARRNDGGGGGAVTVVLPDANPLFFLGGSRCTWVQPAAFGHWCNGGTAQRGIWWEVMGVGWMPYQESAFEERLQRPTWNVKGKSQTWRWTVNSYWLCRYLYVYYLETICIDLVGNWVDSTWKVNGLWCYPSVPFKRFLANGRNSRIFR